MKRYALIVLFATACATTQQETDPYLWLESVDDPRALAWVAEQNERTRRELASVPGFEEMQAQARAALDTKSRVPSVAFHGRWLYNFWRDAEHPRGIYRRTTIDGLAKQQWTTVLDIDAMSKRDGKRWVFKGMNCLEPEERRCLVSLSAGGGDAVEIREFDSETLQFVENGFALPEAKSSVAWVDADTLLVATDFGPGTLSASGYPLVVKQWKRGMPLSAAAIVHQASPSSVRVTPRRVGDLNLISESLTFWTSKVFRLDGSALAIPESATVAGAHRGRLIVRLHDDWKFPAGSVVALDGDAVQLVRGPNASSVIEDVHPTKSVLYVATLENVRARLYRDGKIVDLPDNGTLSIMTVDAESGDALVRFETFLTPPALYLVRESGVQKILQQEPTFDASGLDVTQEWAASKDGTRVPYFVVAPKAMKRDGTNPTHIFSYGGFRNALTPSYSGSYEQHYGAYGKLWLERGGVFVLANIRGGGEFGPKWHSSVLKENRHKVYEDFEAVAENLIRTGISSPKHLGIEGRSNGGLLTLAAMTRRPDLYGAVISGAPLADMRRYHLLLAGASWEAEYGREADSPYHEIRRGADYPPLFVYCSTRDDRVHPGHARKVVAKMLEQGHQVWYFENVEGGHGGASTNEQLAYRIALSYAHLWRALR
jgi:prolyl oligopeptidase